MKKESVLFQRKPSLLDIPPEKEVGPFYSPEKAVGSSGAVMDLRIIIENAMKSQYFQNLPKEMKAGLLKIQKMTTDPFKYASENTASEDKEAIFGLGGPEAQLRDISRYLSKLVMTKGLPDAVRKALIQARNTIESEQWAPSSTTGKRQESPTTPSTSTGPTRGEPTRTPQDKGRRQDRDVGSSEQVALKFRQALKFHGRYDNIFGGLPFEIRRELQKLSLDPESLKKVPSGQPAAEQPPPREPGTVRTQILPGRRPIPSHWQMSRAASRSVVLKFLKTC